MVLSSGVWNCWAPSRPLDAEGFSRFIDEVEGMILQGLVLLYPLPPSR